ncbi:hypothetical protein [Flavitalea sp.]|nr:hypothetical protein [Flavitalea sp.]
MMTKAITGPYKDESTNIIYQLLFCDNMDLYKAKITTPYQYPFDVLFAPYSSVNDLQEIINDDTSDPRVRILACNRLNMAGQKPAFQELLAVIIEVGLDNGLDVLASFQNGTARYINHTGKVLVWETSTDQKANEITNALFQNGEEVIAKIGPWDKPRRPQPAKGNVRLTFLVSDGLYFGEGPIDILFKDPLAAPTIHSATQLMAYITEKALAEDVEAVSR